MQHVEHSNRNIVSETGRIRNIIREGELSKSESVKFSLIESVICIFTDSSVIKYFSLLNQSIFTEIISEI